MLVYQTARHDEPEDSQLDVAATAFARQLDDISAHVAVSVQVLALDYALRSAIAQRDQATMLSALRNHGRRVGANRMLLVDVDGRVEVDTSDQLRAGSAFPFDDLVGDALERPSAAVVASDGHAYWMVVVPVFAPNLVGFIAAAIPVDNSLLVRLQAQSALPRGLNYSRSDGGRDGSSAQRTPAVTSSCANDGPCDQSGVVSIEGVIRGASGVAQRSAAAPGGRSGATRRRARVYAR